MVVNNNHSLNQEQWVNEYTYCERNPGSDELWVFPDTDFAVIAGSMGCLGLTVTRPGDFAPALEQGLAAGRPAVVEAKRMGTVIRISGKSLQVWRLNTEKTDAQMASLNSKQSVPRVGRRPAYSVRFAGVIRWCNGL